MARASSARCRNVSNCQRSRQSLAACRGSRAESVRQAAGDDTHLGLLFRRRHHRILRDLGGRRRGGLPALLILRHRLLRIVVPVQRLIGSRQLVVDVAVLIFFDGGLEMRHGLGVPAGLHVGPAEQRPRRRNRIPALAACSRIGIARSTCWF